MTTATLLHIIQQWRALDLTVILRPLFLHNYRLTGKYFAPEEFILKAAALPLPKQNQVWGMFRTQHQEEASVTMRRDTYCKLWLVKLINPCRSEICALNSGQCAAMSVSMPVSWNVGMMHLLSSRMISRPIAYSFTVCTLWILPAWGTLHVTRQSKTAEWIRFPKCREFHHSGPRSKEGHLE